jgi:hypothetical protein
LDVKARDRIGRASNSRDQGIVLELPFLVFGPGFERDITPKDIIYLTVVNPMIDQDVSNVITIGS